MKMIKENIKRLSASILALTFILSLSLASCSTKSTNEQEADQSETMEQVEPENSADNSEEHPSSGGSEHPAGGSEHPAHDSTHSHEGEHEHPGK